MSPVVELPESQHFPGGDINRYLEHAVSVTPSDTVSYVPPVTVYVGKSGDVAIVQGLGGDPVVFANVAQGTVLPCKASIIRATGTTARQIVAMT